jgi:hypothetical protein
MSNPDAMSREELIAQINSLYGLDDTIVLRVINQLKFEALTEQALRKTAQLQDHEETKRSAKEDWYEFA